MGDVHPPPVRECAVQMDAARRRQGRAACGSGPAELERTALDRYCAVEGVVPRANSVARIERSEIRGDLPRVSLRSTRATHCSGYEVKMTGRLRTPCAP